MPPCIRIPSPRFHPCQGIQIPISATPLAVLLTFFSIPLNLLSTQNISQPLSSGCYCCFFPNCIFSSVFQILSWTTATYPLLNAVPPQFTVQPQYHYSPSNVMYYLFQCFGNCFQAPLPSLSNHDKVCHGLTMKIVFDLVIDVLCYKSILIICRSSSLLQTLSKL